MRANAETLGFDIEAMAFLDLSPSSEFFTEVQTYDIFSPSEVEREPTTQKIIERVQAVKPQRVFLDAITQFRYLAADEFQFRKQVLSFLRFLVEGGATVVFTSEGTSSAPDDDLQFISDGVIYLELRPEGRTLTVTKLRGSNFRSWPSFAAPDSGWYGGISATASGQLSTGFCCGSDFFWGSRNRRTAARGTGTRDGHGD